MTAPVADVNIGDFEERTALMKAAVRGRSAVVSLLVERGAKISKRDKGGKTAREYATENGWPEVAEMLSGSTRK